MLLAAIVACLLVAGFSSGNAVLANRMWPERTAWRLAVWSVNALVIAIFILTVFLLVDACSTPCPEGGACDAGAMAAVGELMAASFSAIAAVLIGTPVAYATVSWLRRR